MRNNLPRILFVITLVSALLTPMAAQAASPYDNAPADLKSYEAALLKNLAIVKYGFNYGVAFAGDYSLSQEQKDKGVNSMLLTTASTLNPENDSLKGCFAKGNDQKISIIYSDRTYDGTCWSWNRDGTDFAVVSTSVTLPRISLYDSYWPKEGGWIEVAYYVDGFGIQLRPSKVRIINEKLYVLGIDKISPSMKYGGLAFNSLGNFVGTVSPFGPGTIPGDYLKLNGAPLQCGWENSSATITNCSTRSNIAQSARAGVWTIDSPSTPEANPSPKPVVDSAANEVDDANAAVVDALAALSESIDTCNSLVEEIKEVLGDFEVATPLLDSCSDLDSKFREIDSKRALAFGGGGTSTTKINSLNNLVDLALAQTDLADEAVATLQDSQPLFVSITKDLLKFGIEFATTAEDIANLNNRISGLPRATQVMIQKNANYKKLQNIFPSDYELEDLLNQNLPDLSAISSISQLKNAPALVVKAKESKSFIFKSGPLIRSVEKLIPKFVCVKGKIVSVTPATGKCASGFTKTSTA
jgi:hypothetical protein